MTVFGFLLVLAAALSHATWNFLLKRVNGGAELVWLFSMMTAVLYLPAVIAVLATEDRHLGPEQALFIIGSALLHLAYFLLLQVGYRKGDLSLVYPTARAVGPLLSVSFAVAFLGETPSLQIVIGGGAIIIGVLCLNRRSGKTVKKIDSSLAFGLGAGCLIGSYTVWDAYAVATLLVSPILLDYGSSLTRCVLLTPVALRRRKQMRSLWSHHKWAILGIAVFNPLAYILVLYALTFSPVVYVAPTRELSVLFTVALGAILLKEGDLARRMKWALLILIGVAVLATG